MEILNIKNVGRCNAAYLNSLYEMMADSITHERKTSDHYID
jgi:hypothetical protein